MPITTLSPSLKRKLTNYGLLTSGVLLLPGSSNLKAEVIYTDIADVTITAGRATISTPDQDIDGDGTNDFKASAYIYYYATTRQDRLGANQNSIGPVVAGSTFGPSSSLSPNATSFIARLVPPGSSAPSIYMGLAFNISGATHYGWIQYSYSYPTPGAGVTLTIKDFAYESEPGVGIIVGAIGTTLPVQLTTLTAEEEKGKVAIKWTTAAELDNQGYHIQRSANGQSWESIGFVEGNGTTNEDHSYAFVDEAPLIGASLYRLAQVDFDGTVELTDAVSVNVDQNVSALLVSPNPVATSELTLNFVLPDAENVQVFITDMAGKQLSTSTFEGVSGSNEYRMEVGSLPTGTYLARVQLRDEVLVRRFVKQ
jgi:hypothetical protein